uniref:Uncharacterized protein n=1 Tax=Quercus lobata TaxID=97700 RepID=A0A7N2R881_QUELO
MRIIFFFFSPGVQALCEELTRKAADLQWENENLKQMVMAIKVEVEETPPEHKSADVATSTSSSTNCPLFLFNRPPLMPVFWPSIIPSQNPVPSLHGRQSATVIPSNIDMPVKTEATASTEARPTNDLNKTPVGCPSDGGSQHTKRSKNQPFTQINKKLTDAVAAAGARKRRTELTKLKNLNGRQCRMHC